ncbi:MAG: Vitamin B12 dependent methionine synthase activation subunit [Lachnospiraceae bacterium]|nr:Vitamin B12 dependent methionine synthase activation subunit [Lachnospiraceae bacterium]
MEETVYLKRYQGSEDGLSDVNLRELWRYAGYMGGPVTQDDALNLLLKETLDECQMIYNYGVCYVRFKVNWANAKPILPFETESKNLAKLLNGCDEGVMFAATIGLGIDRLIAKYQRFNQTKALLLQALGAERVEALCDRFCDEIKEQENEKGLTTTPRFSPGYGDMPLDLQRDFVRILDCNRKIGISLNDSLLMTPSKSVTAIFGIKRLDKCENFENEDKCRACEKEDCEYRLD